MIAWLLKSYEDRIALWLELFNDQDFLFLWPWGSPKTLGECYFLKSYGTFYWLWGSLIILNLECYSDCKLGVSNLKVLKWVNLTKLPDQPISQSVSEAVHHFFTTSQFSSDCPLEMWMHHRSEVMHKKRKKAMIVAEKWVQAQRQTKKKVSLSSREVLSKSKHNYHHHFWKKRSRGHKGSQSPFHMWAEIVWACSST